IALEPGAGALEAESLAEGTRRVIHDPEREPLGGGDAGAVLAALRIVRAAMPSLAAMRAQVVVDTRTFLADGEKLGLGRSAATVTAAVAAFLAGVRRQDRGEILEAALAAHALFQDGRGSGADVAAAARGGVLEFRRDGARVTVTARALPRLVAAARRVGAAAKPSGAGGGDCGIALATSGAQADAVAAAWRAEGIVPLPVAIAAEGVCHEVHDQVAREVSLG